MRRLFTALLAFLVLGSSLGAVAAKADTMTWKIRSFSQYAVDVAFYSQNRRNIWPSTTTTYVVRNYDVASFPLSCIRGEKICYGAAVRGNANHYWGQGIGGKQACKGCCFTCDGVTVTPVMNLNER